MCDLWGFNDKKQCYPIKGNRIHNGKGKQNGRMVCYAKYRFFAHIILFYRRMFMGDIIKDKGCLKKANGQLFETASFFFYKYVISMSGRGSFK
jgi:hypothetical protein